MGSLRQRLSQLPDVIELPAGALFVTALYFVASATTELLNFGTRFPIAPEPWLALPVALINVGLSVGLVLAIGWVRPLVALVPLAGYPIEYGLGAVPIVSIQAAELVTVCVVIPVLVIYFFYFYPSGKLWFARQGRTKTVADLLAEKRDVSGQEIEWAKAYEREQLRSWARFPRPGEVYELSADAEISYLTHWGAPFTGGGKGHLPKGTRVRVVDAISDPEPICVHADPLEKSLVEAALVPETDRSSVDYAGFSLFIQTAELNKLFHLVSKGDHGV